MEIDPDDLKKEPLSLEELLSKKQAEEALRSKVNEYLFYLIFDSIILTEIMFSNPEEWFSTFSAARTSWTCVCIWRVPLV